MKTMKRVAAILIALLLATGAAGAEILTLEGTVEAGSTTPVYAPIGGTVSSVSVEAGMKITSGTKLYSYKTEKIYASEAGTVTGVFVTAGDDAEKVTEKYGADIYIEGNTKYTVSASTSKAYSAVDTTFVHVGETVYILNRSDVTRKGTGTITSVDGTNYTVTVTKGSFVTGTAVTLYRDSAYTETQKIGRGTIARVNPVAVTATGAVTKVAVKNGAKVKKGDLLMEVLTGTFDSYKSTGTTVKSEKDGVVMSVSVEPGATISKGDVVAQIATSSSIRVEAKITADDRSQLKAGDKVKIELEAVEGKSYDGTVSFISETPEEATGEDTEVTYKVVVKFTPDDAVSLGMGVVVTLPSNAEEPEDAGDPVELVETVGDEDTEEPAEAPAAPELPEGASLPEGGRPEAPEGTVPGSGNE